MKLNTMHFKFALVAFLVVAVAAMALGHPLIPHDILAGLGMLPLAIGDTEIVEIKSLIEKQGQAWEEFKKTNDELIKAKADGKAVADLEAKLATIGKAMDGYAELQAQVEETLKKMQRPGGAGSSKSDEELAVEVKNFNATRRAYVAGGAVLTDIDVKQYIDYKSAFFKLARGGKEPLSADEQKAMSVGVDSDGGYLMPDATTGRIVKKTFDLSPIRQIANVMTISGDALEGIIDNDESSYGWVSEIGARTDTTTPQVGKYRVEAFEMYSAPKATQKLLDDAAIDVEAWLAGKVADKFARVEGAAFITGTGVGQPRGFTTYTTAATADATRSWGTLEHVKTGANGDFGASSPADVLFDLIQAFKPWFLQNANFVTRRDVIGKIRKLKEATTNAYMWQPGLQQGMPDKLLGYPIVIAQDMPALATDSLSLALGDFSEGYQIVDRLGIRTLRDPYTSKPYVIFYSTKRVGGGVLNFEAIKFLKFSA